MIPCPSCGEEPSALVRDARDIEDELSWRERALPRGRDLTEVVLGTPADILRCQRCDILIRADAPDDDAFRRDRYRAEDLRALHETHSAAFRAKARDYRALLPRGARVAEIGSYAGGFLRAASEWRWRPTGVDIGRDTSAFTAALGFDTCDAFEFGDRSLDALFVWNCFEQLSAPVQLLAAGRNALRRGGLLIIRVPDADFYLRRRELRALACNGLLGWPHRFGFGVTSLRRLAGQHGFALRRVLRRPPLPPLRLAGERAGWIELTFYRAERRRPGERPSGVSRNACCSPRNMP